MSPLLSKCRKTTTKYNEKSFIICYFNLFTYFISKFGFALFGVMKSVNKWNFDSAFKRPFFFGHIKRMGCPATSASTQSTISFFNASAAISDNPSGICPIVSLASPATLIAVLLCYLSHF